jgi:hypothetical protein
MDVLKADNKNKKPVLGAALVHFDILCQYLIQEFYKK